MYFRMKKYIIVLINKSIIFQFYFLYFASLIQSSWGQVRVESIKIPTQNGQWVVADLFKPYKATSDNPAPLVIIILAFKDLKKPYQISLLNFQEGAL